MDEVIVNFGGELKALDNGHFGGYLVRFSDASNPDLAGDYFTKETDFGIKDGQTTPVFFHHRQPLKTRDGKAIVVKAKIGEATLSVDDDGVLIDAIIYNREKYEKAISKAGRARKSDGSPYLGWSSGTAPHLCDREERGGANFIKFWQLGGDASVTPTPCEPVNDVIPLKSLDSIKFTTLDEPDLDVVRLDVAPAKSIKGLFTEKLSEQTPSVWTLESALRDVERDIAKANAASNVTGVAVDVESLVRAAGTEFVDARTPIVVAQILAWDGDGEFYLKSIFDELTSEDEGARAALKFSDHLEVVLAAAREVHIRAKSIQELRVKAGRVLSEANRTRLAKLLESLRTNADEIETLLTDAEPKPKEEKSVDPELLNGMVAEFQLIQRRAHTARRP